MRILWFPRLQFDTDRLHITTWRQMCQQINNSGHSLKIAVVGKADRGEFKNQLITLPVIKIKFLRILSFWFFGFFKFMVYCMIFKPAAIILDVYSVWFSLPLIFIPRKFRPVLIMDSRSPVYLEFNSKNGGKTPAWSSEEKLKSKVMRLYEKSAYLYCRLFSDGLTVITRYYKERICRDFNFDSSRVGIWSSGVNLGYFQPATSKHKNILPEFLKNKFVIMQHGEMSDHRGMFETIQALNLLNREDMCLFWLGEVVRSYKAKQIIFDKIKKLDTHKRVFIMPPVEHAQVPEYIKYADCAIMAYPNIEYWNNNNPIKLIEYLAMGKFIICTDMWTFRDAIGDAKCAYFLKDNNPKTIAEAIDYCYRNRAYLEEWGHQGVAIAKNRYAWEKQANNLISFIKSMQIRNHK